MNDPPVVCPVDVGQEALRPKLDALRSTINALYARDEGALWAEAMRSSPWQLLLTGRVRGRRGSVWSAHCTKQSTRVRRLPSVASQRFTRHSEPAAVRAGARRSLCGQRARQGGAARTPVHALSVAQRLASPGIYEFGMLSVHPDYEGRGLGRTLVNKAEAVARDQVEVAGAAARGPRSAAPAGGAHHAADGVDAARPGLAAAVLVTRGAPLKQPWQPVAPKERLLAMYRRWGYAVVSTQLASDLDPASAREVAR